MCASNRGGRGKAGSCLAGRGDCGGRTGCCACHTGTGEPHGEGGWGVQGHRVNVVTGFHECEGLRFLGDNRFKTLASSTLLAVPVPLIFSVMSDLL